MLSKKVYFLLSSALFLTSLVHADEQEVLEKSISFFLELITSNSLIFDRMNARKRNGENGVNVVLLAPKPLTISMIDPGLFVLVMVYPCQCMIFSPA